VTAGPTIESRRRRRFILLSADATLATLLRTALPEGWEMTTSADVDAVGGFEEILQHRFLLLDLDDPAIDPLAAIDHLRRDLMLNIAIVCLGGAKALRDAARLARADRFFERAEAVERMRQFCAQYGWGA
jgi:CheY-like chemotaxis protein